jgi:hypothetical protein
MRPCGCGCVVSSDGQQNVRSQPVDVRQLPGQTAARDRDQMGLAASIRSRAWQSHGHVRERSFGRSEMPNQVIQRSVNSSAPSMMWRRTRARPDEPVMARLWRASLAEGVAPRGACGDGLVVRGTTWHPAPSISFRNVEVGGSSPITSTLQGTGLRLVTTPR